MGDKGVGIASDRTLNEFAGPRFGPWAAYSLTKEDGSAYRIDCRTRQRRAQTNGVRYDRPFLDWNPLRFEQDDIDPVEESAWKALAWWTANHIDPSDSVAYDGLPDDRKVPKPRVRPTPIEELSAAGVIPGGGALPGAVIAIEELAHIDQILNMVKGLARRAESALPHATPGDSAWEQAAMFCLNNGIQPSDLRTFTPDHIHEVQRVFDQVKDPFRLWDRMNGSNVPLRKRVDGRRDWDINIDGIAHYGMLPDFFQDVHNTGLGGSDLQPLFNSAEDYIQMWKKAEDAASGVHDVSIETVRRGCPVR